MKSPSRGRVVVEAALIVAVGLFLSSLPVFADLQKLGGGSSTLVIGTTGISGGATTQILFNLAGVVSSDADLTFATDTLTATKLSTGGAPTAANAISVQETAGQITFEGATSDTIQTRIAVTDPTSTDKTFTLPNLSGTAALANVGQGSAVNLLVTAGTSGAFAGAATAGGAINTQYAAFLPGETALSPDGGRFEPGTLSNSIHFNDIGDGQFDFQNPCNGVQGTAACPNPTFIIHSGNQDTLEWLTLSHDGNAGVIQAANSTRKSGEIKFGRTVALTEAGGAETVITITTATTQSFGLELSYQVRASDATPDYAIREGSLKLVCVNNATVVTCTKDATTQADDESVLINTNSKTLTYAIATDVATASVAKITFDIDSDMTVTAAEITFTAILNGSGVIS